MSKPESVVAGLLALVIIRGLGVQDREGLGWPPSREEPGELCGQGTHLLQVGVV